MEEALEVLPLRVAGRRLGDRDRPPPRQGLVELPRNSPVVARRAGLRDQQLLGLLRPVPPDEHPADSDVVEVPDPRPAERQRGEPVGELVVGELGVRRRHG